MSTTTSSETVVRTTSWAAATWVTPVVPALWVLVFLLVGGRTGVGETQTGGYAAGLGLAVVIALLGAGLTRAPGAHARGLGIGLVAGGLACALPSLWVLLT